MFKRKLGNALMWIGSPPIFGIVGMMSGFTSGDPENLLHFLWGFPLAVLTCPLISFSYLGNKILNSLDEKEFLQRTANLERITSVPADAITLEEFEGEYFAQFLPYGVNDKFSSFEEANKTLQDLGYEQKLFVNHDENIMEIYWIKK